MELFSRKTLVGNGSGATNNIGCCDFRCERTSKDPFCAKNVFFVYRNHDAAEFCCYPYAPAVMSWRLYQGSLARCYVTTLLNVI